jgi:hypothetical protein
MAHQLSALLFAVCLSGLVCRTASAQLEDPSKLPPSGNLSTSLKSGAAEAEVPEPFGGEDISGEGLAPITGSVSRVTQDSWSMKVFNNTKDEYSVDLDVFQLNMQGQTVKTDSFSYRLKPGTSEQEKISAGIGARDAELNLRRWKNVSEEKRKRAAQEAEDNDDDSGQ